MPATVYTGVLRSLEDVIKAHLQLPSHLRTVSADIPNDSEFGTLKSNVPYEGPQTVLKYFDLGHELDIDFLVSAEESGFDDAGADSRGL